MASDLMSKYQKLGQEYQKVRAQVSVLKKAVIDEQAVNKNCQETLKQKDQAIRKYEQEIDSLQFRNDQLSRRVEILQGELDDLEKRGSKPKGGSDARANEDDANLVKDEELYMKIKENEMLHQQLSEADQQHRIVVQKLQDRLEFLEKERENHDKTVDEANSRYARVIERIEEDRASMEAKAKRQEEELKIANIMNEKYQQQLRGVHKDLKDKLEKTTHILKQKLPFNDTDKKEWNILNVPVCDRSHQLQARSLVDEFTGIFNSFMSSLSEFLSYIEQRTKYFSPDLRQENPTALEQKLADHLRPNSSHIKRVIGAMTSFSEFVQKEAFVSLETCTPLQDVSLAFASCVHYFRQILPYLMLSTNEQCNLLPGSEQMEHLTKDFIKFTCKMVGNLHRIERYLYVLAWFGKNQSLANAIATCFKHMHSHIQMLSSTCQDLCTTYYLRSEEEQKLPIVSERLINTDKAILKSLTSLSSAAIKMMKFFDANVQFISRSCGFKRKGFSADEEQGLVSSVKDFQKRALTYMKSIKKESDESIPHSVAVHNYKTLVTSTESRDTLAKQVLNSQETLSRLEQEREHWMLEAQLLKVKYEKEAKRVAILGEELKKARSDVEQRFSGVSVESIDEVVQLEKTSGSGTTPRSPSMSSTTSSQEISSPPPQLGSIEVVSTDKDKDSQDSHEAMMKEHLTSRISGLTRQAQQADSKAVAFYAECRALYKQLVLADKSKKKTENELNNAHKSIEELQDELETTKRSYEEQLRTLSDHLCGMNEQLSSQKDKTEPAKTPTKGRGGISLGRKK